ncbi:MAG: prepilin-type N-terminal cleavage/methylation domain-containing protein [Desulfobacteraceae bacterium]|nr:prepilin-type N-terminal cleavage/methylation domain-containing protein [Desulfobacteraceae bacterium]MCB9494616.1 prepilin-type N-terminal cleavage/methylation domain-containing protein [Desulfobacteraceae bacterium]
MSCICESRFVTKGFSLIELMVALAIFSILAGIAVPSFLYFISWHRAEVAVNEFASGLEKARYLAVRKGVLIKLSVDVDGDEVLDSGFCIYIDKDKNNKVSENDEILHIQTFKGVKIDKDKTTIDGASYPLNFSKSGFVKGGSLWIAFPSGKFKKITLLPPLGEIKITTETG